MCSIDDLIMCCKGEFPSIYLLLQAIKLFSNSTSLKAKIQKSTLHCCGMNETRVQRVMDEAGLVRSHMPFKYLGVLVCSKRISMAQCEVLVEKMIARIRIWSSITLLESNYAILFYSLVE